MDQVSYSRQLDMVGLAKEALPCEVVCKLGGHAVYWFAAATWCSVHAAAAVASSSLPGHSGRVQESRRLRSSCRARASRRNPSVFAAD